MLTTELQALKVFAKMPLIQLFLLINLSMTGLFGWLWYDNQQTILEQQKECNKTTQQYNQKVEEIYKHFLEKTENQIEVIREIQNQKSHEKVRKNNHRSGSS